MNDFVKIAQDLLNKLSPKDKQDLKQNLVPKIREGFVEWALKNEFEPLKGVRK